MSGSFQRSRTRLQSRFPSFYDRSNDNVPKLKKHRSKSFDNRYSGSLSFETPSYLLRNNNLNKNQGTRESFFNDSITIPVQNINKNEQLTTNDLLNNNNTPKLSKQRLYQSNAEESDLSKKFNDWTTYDKFVRYKYFFFNKKF